MTIEAGALALRISEIGGEQVEKKLTDIDNKAKALGSKTVQLHMTAPGIERLDNQLAQLGKQAQLYSQGAKFASTKAESLRELGAVEKDLRGIIASGLTPLEQRIKAEQTLAGLTDKQITSGKALVGSLAAQYLTYQGIQQVIREAVKWYDFATEASDNQALAHRRLSAIARLTGASLEFLQGVASDARSQFHLSTASAEDLTGQFAKLSTRAGDVARTGGLMTAWLDLGAANGLTLDQTLQALTTTLGGQDEGLNKLGLANPAQIWKKWADAAGMTVGAMTEQQKWLAIVTEVMAQGAKVNGEYGKGLETTQGKQIAFNEALKDTAALFGKNMNIGRDFFYGIGTAALTAFNAMDKFSRGLGDAVQNFLRAHPTLAALARLTGDLPPEAAKDHVVSLEFQQTTGLMKPPPKPTAMTAAERKAAAEAAEEARIQRLLERTAVGMPSVVDRIPGGTTPPAAGKLKGVKAFGMADVIDKEFDALAEKMKAKTKLVQDITTEAGMAVGRAFGDAFTAAFEGGGNFFEAFGKSLLSSLGNILMSIGTEMIAYAAIITPLTAIPGPWQVLGMGGPATAAVGLGLTALGAAMGAIGAKGGGKGGGGAGSASRPPAEKDNEFAIAFDPDRKLRKQSSAVMPSARSLGSATLPDAKPTVVFNATIIGKDDPKAVRDITEMVEAGVGRGIGRGIRKAG